MRGTLHPCMYGLLIALMIGSPAAWAARRGKPAPQVALTEAGKQLEARYASTLEALKAEILAALSEVSDQKKTAFLEAMKAEEVAKAALDRARKNFGKITRARGLVGHAKGKWIGGADKRIAKAEADLEKAKTPAEREKAQKDLAAAKQNRANGVAALKERQAKLDAALKEEPQLTKAVEAAEAALDDAKQEAMKSVKALGLSVLLTSDKLDGKLAGYVVMKAATPRGLAAFAQRGKAEQKLIEQLLTNEDLMVQMAVADGANGGKYGKAMEIYTAVQKGSSKAKSGTLQRLALAISLEHAVPVGQRNAKAKTDARATVDPVARYKQYEKAFLNGELDPAFKGLSVWDYRMVVNGHEPDETLAWGREMLRTYRPDHIMTDDYRWRYVAAVRTDIRYGSQYNKFDKPELQFFQNILMNGGVCGRRAFFGRFILRAFGIPTTARPQRGHAALAHWTPDGWVVCLGGGWGVGWTKGRYNRDLDFLANTQARMAGTEAFMRVKRAQWVGTVVGEKPVYGFLSDGPDFWYGVSLYHQRQIIEDAKAVALAAVGEELGEANESDVKYAVVDVERTEAEKGIVVGKDGTIVLPAAACSKPTKSTRKIIFMHSSLGGKQLHYSRTGGAESFEYTFDAPKAGAYALTARVAVPSWGQILRVVANGGAPVDIELPLTTGLWGETAPVDVSLKKGKNVLTVSRTGDNIRGLTIKDFTLSPVK